MYRYPRGQPGSSSLPRPALGTGAVHGARTASPEPGGAIGGAAPALLGGELKESRLSQEEMIADMERELQDLRNACALKDQRIADLERTDAPASRLKRDIRLLASELHATRKELSDSMRDLQELQQQLNRNDQSGAGRDGGASGPRDVVDGGGQGVAATPAGGASAASGTDRGAQLRGRIAELQEENRQLRDQVLALQARPAARHTNGTAAEAGAGAPPPGPGALDVHARAPSGAATQRAVELAPAQGGAGTGMAASGAYAVRQPYPDHQPSAAQAAPAEEHIKPCVYSNHDLSGASTIGPITLQGIGIVDGVSSVAKILLQRIHSSVLAAHRRAQMAAAAGPGAPGQHLGLMLQPQGN